MVGNNHLAFALSINGRLADAQGLAAYTNLSHRLQYAVGYQQSPFYFGEGSQFLDNGDGTLTEQDVIARYLDREAFAIGIYPLESLHSLRARAHAGGPRALVPRLLADRRPVGFRSSDATQNEVAGSSKYYVEPSLSYVSDNTLFGYTGADLRPALSLRGHSRGRAVPVARIAGRLSALRRDSLQLSHHRHAPHGESRRTAAMPTACRSISATAISFAATTIRASRSRTRNCPATVSNAQQCNRLLGSKVVFGNIELRFPLVRGGLAGVIPLPPIEGAFFYDAGTTWFNGQKVEFKRRQPGRSRERALAAHELRLRASRESLQLRDPAMGLRDSEGFSRTTRILAILVVSDVLIA